MNPVLLIMNPRNIPVTETAFRKLKIDKAWLRGYTEEQLNSIIPKFINETNYSHYILTSDDLLPTQEALDNVLVGMKKFDVFTGWCNITPTIRLANVRLRKPPGQGSFFSLTHRVPILSNITAPIKLRTFPSPKKLPEGFFRVFFAGFSFTSLTRELWQRFPFKALKTGGSDFLLCERLNDNDIPIYCHKNTYCYHLHWTKDFIIGKVDPEVIVETYPLIS